MERTSNEHHTYARPARPPTAMPAPMIPRARAAAPGRANDQQRDDGEDSRSLRQRQRCCWRPARWRAAGSEQEIVGNHHLAHLYPRIIQRSGKKNRAISTAGQVGPEGNDRVVCVVPTFLPSTC